MAVRDVVQAAAGVGGGDNLYVEDVFSTYLYTGNSSTQTIENGIALGDGNYGPSVDFDGTNDYLSRSSDLTGNADGKTFTLSAWGYRTAFSTHFIYQASTDRFNLYGKSNGNFELAALNSSGSYVLEMIIGGVSDAPLMPLNTWTHILISIDLTNTSNRYVYVNDVAYAGSLTYNVYTNDNIDFTRTAHSVGSNTSGGQKWKGRLSNVFLDYTYRDLSVEANRRLFITADGQPATGLASLSPILYMPLDGLTASVGTNSGTGGDFTVNGSPTVLTQGGPYIEAGYGQGGLVWIKARGLDTPYPQDHSLIDTERGPTTALMSNTTSGNSTQEYSLGTNGTFNSNGFTIASTNNQVNNANVTVGYASWTFRKAPKFFDIVTYTGTGVARTVSHNLGSVPGCIIVKVTDTSGNWMVYHRANTAAPETDYLKLNSPDATTDLSSAWNDTAPTDTEFTVGDQIHVNASGSTYVAYLFAHDAGGFGDDGQQNVISCGSFTTDASGNATVTLGYEPQYILMKLNVNGVVNWVTYDIMRGWGLGNVAQLYPNISQAEDAYTGGPYFFPTATGFVLNGTLGLGNNQTNAYIAIRRPMKTPEAGTEVFAPYISDATAPFRVESGFPVDSWLYGQTTGANKWFWFDRIRGSQWLKTETTSAETAYTAYFDDMEQASITGSGYSGYINYAFRRAPSVFDVVCYDGSGVLGLTLNHNLSAVPEMIWVKNRSASNDNWYAYHSSLGNTKYLGLNTTTAEATSINAWNNTSPTSTQFTVGAFDGVNGSSGYDYVAYLFASCPGVSKVGSYTGTGADLNVDCGFSAGARFILIKRTDSAGDWYVWDSARGIVSGNDPYLLLNSSAAEEPNTDYIDPLASGFTVTSSAPAALNASGGTYIFLAIA